MHCIPRAGIELTHFLSFPQHEFPKSEAHDRMVESLWLFYLPDDPHPHGCLIDSVVERMPWTSDFRLTTSPRKEVHLLKREGTDNWQEACGEAIQELVDLARERKVFARQGKKTEEQFPIVGANFDIGIERSAFSMFGIIGRGSHMTVYVRTEQGLKFWIPRRSATKSTYPGMLDQAVAGGVARGESPLECIVREAGEEAALSAEMVRENVVAAGTVTWFNVSDERAGGEPGLMNPGILYAYDLQVGEDVVFKPVEGDIESFSLMGVDDVKESLRRGDFKPSCAMVMLDFFIRHGLITAEDERDYNTIAILVALLLSGFVAALVPTTWNGRSYDCKCYLGDDCWPKAEEWSTLNTTLNGNLAVHIPPGAVCHNTYQGPLGNISTYNEAACSSVSVNFQTAQWATDQPAAALWTYYTNETCRPTSNPSAPCTLGYYGVYVVLAKTYEDVKAGVDFARTHDLRLVIRNTGHDFLGRSTGWGALVINTHGFKDATFISSYTGAGDYHGSAVIVGAGIQGGELLKVGNAQDPPVTVVVGECSTVGPAGGFVQGGGHGPWTTVKGMAADTVLEFKVLTAAGDIVTANADTNSDLFWALRGGGPSAFGVILSATFQTFVDVPSAGATLDINPSHTDNRTLVWEAITIFHSYSNHFVDNGLYVYFEVGNFGLHVRPFLAVNQTAAQLDAIIAPVLRDLDDIGIRYSTTTKQYQTFFALYNDLFEGEGAGISALTGGWVFAHRDIQRNNTNIINSFKNLQSKGASAIGHMWNPAYGMADSNNALNPRFRDASVHVIAAMSVSSSATWEQKMAAQRTLTFDINQKMKEAGPSGFGYVNEADSNQPGWQTAFYGTNYPKLLDIRKKWDPNGVFYAIATPGTEDWEVIDYGTKLCKKSDA